LSTSSQLQLSNSGRARDNKADLILRCPGCRQQTAPLSSVTAEGWRCPACDFHLAQRNGILRALPAERRGYYGNFAEEYLTIRRDEGRGSEDPAYYLALPYEDTTGRLSSQWVMRGKTYRYFESKVLPDLENELSGALNVLDLGAGPGWLSYRLAVRGHRPAAVDLLDDALDGLGAAHHYHDALKRSFPAVQAEFDNLPFADSQFDLAIFNASFHYATDYRQTLQEVRRCMRWAGRIVILDTPIYERYEHGEWMREERHRQFEDQYGFRSDSVPSMEYLDQTMMRELSKDLNLRWTVYRPWYGWRWHLRPIERRWKGRRPPSRFWILVGSWTKA
jgi:ubiquinone/menaquinone biosynthesis C-methylase UbiE